MANLLANPALWKDQNDNSPPAAWNGSAYVWTNEVIGTPTMTLKAGAAEGDTIEGEWIITPDPHSSRDPNWYVNDERLFPDSPVSIALHAGDIVRIEPQMVNCGYDETLTITPPTPAPPVLCEELGRVTRIYASGYDRARIHDGRLVRGESRCLVMEFNGAIPPARTVTAVTWRCADPSVIVMSNARIQAGARSVAVDVRANWPCATAIKCEATLDNGEAYMQLIRLVVIDVPWFQGDTAPTTGPTTLTAP